MHLRWQLQLQLPPAIGRWSLLPQQRGLAMAWRRRERSRTHASLVDQLQVMHVRSCTQASLVDQLQAMHVPVLERLKKSKRPSASSLVLLSATLHSLELSGRLLPRSLVLPPR